MRRGYDDPELHFKANMRRLADRYVDGLQKAGLRPNAKLTRAVAERAVREARRSYVQEATEIRDQNIRGIMRDHHMRMNQIKREGARLRLMTCPPIALLFGLLAWYNFSHPGSFMLGICYVIGSLAFLAMLVLGALFDRPRE